MIILVFTSHIVDRQNNIIEPEEFKFIWDPESTILKQHGGGTLGKYPDIDSVFDKLRKYFYGTNYIITNIKRGIDE